MNHQLIGLQPAQRLIDDDERQADLVGHVVPRRVAASHQVLENQRLDFGIGQARFTKRLWLGRHEGLFRLQFVRLFWRGFRSGTRIGHLLVNPRQQGVEPLIFLLLVLRLRSRQGKKGVVSACVAAGQFFQEVIVGRSCHGCGVSKRSWDGFSV